jgi:hypothetical protein
MKKNFLLGILVIALVFGMTVIGCDTGGNTDPKSITITGIPQGTTDADIYIMKGFSSQSDLVAGGPGVISGTSVTFTLLTPSFKSWTGNGSYYINVDLDDDEYYYTNGKTFAELGINGPEDAHKLPKFNISSANSTIDLSKFQETQ